jgi:beta-N-acetylhexosaminidase
MTLEAGSDTVLVSHSYEKQKKAIEAVISAVKKGRISEKRIDHSVKRILNLKRKRFSIDKFTKADTKKINLKFSEKVAADIAQNGVTVVRDQENLLPQQDITDSKIGVIDFKMGRMALVEDDTEHDNKLVEYLKEMGAEIDYYSVEQTSERDLDVSRFGQGLDFIIVCTYNAVTRQRQADIANKLAEKMPVIVVALRNPYDSDVVTEVSTFVTTYDYSPANLKAVAQIISGEIEAAGQLPVTLGGVSYEN